MSILNNEITSYYQAKNGTRAFLCSRTGAVYTSHSNGYVRRQIAPWTRISKGHSGQYQINVRKNGKRLMLSKESDRLALIEIRAENYRK